MELTLLPVKPGTLSAKDKKALSAAGVIVIEHDNPSELRLLRPWSEVDGSDMLVAAMRGCIANTGNASSAYAFTNAMAKVIEARWAKGLKP